MAKHAASHKPSLTFYTRRTIRGAVCLISDTHAGSPHALQPPVYRLFSGNEIHYNPLQCLLWHYYENDTCARMAEYRRHDVDTRTIHVGDPTEGVHHDSEEVVSVTKADHVGIGVATLAPLADHSRGILMIRSTPAHGGQLGSLDEAVAKGLEDRGHKVIPEKSGQRVFRGLRRYEFMGVTINAWHHITGGSTMAARNSTLGRVVVEHMARCGERGEKACDYLVRAHKHQHSDTGTAYKTRGIVLPAWQLPTAFVDKHVPDTDANIGTAFIEIYSDGTHHLEVVSYPIIKGIEHEQTISKIEKVHS